MGSTISFKTSAAAAVYMHSMWISSTVSPRFSITYFIISLYGVKGVCTENRRSLVLRSISPLNIERGGKRFVILITVQSEASLTRMYIFLHTRPSLTIRPTSGS